MRTQSPPPRDRARRGVLARHPAVPPGAAARRAVTTARTASTVCSSVFPSVRTWIASSAGRAGAMARPSVCAVAAAAAQPGSCGRPHCLDRSRAPPRAGRRAPPCSRRARPSRPRLAAPPSRCRARRPRCRRLPTSSRWRTRSAARTCGTRATAETTRSTSGVRISGADVATVHDHALQPTADARLHGHRRARARRAPARLPGRRRARWPPMPAPGRAGRNRRIAARGPPRPPRPRSSCRTSRGRRER